MTMNENIKKNNRTGLEVAVIGMAGRFPGSQNIHEFWENLKNGVESITLFSDDEAIKSGNSLELIKDPNYVNAFGDIENAEYFDAFFFGYTPKEAKIMNPEMRFFHECAWEAMEDAGYNPESYEGLIGVYAGASSNFIWEAIALLSGETKGIGNFSASQLTNTNFLTTKISYIFNLKGPSSFIQTACSTSLAAIHWACRSVLSGECHIALAGGVRLDANQKQGYIYEEGMILSPDGHCRAFDAGAKGTVGGNGVGIVVLKRLKNAIADRDHIYAVVKGSAINNDGNRKVGYTAPSVPGQADSIRTAQGMAHVEPETIGYIETHGTGTPLGDPVEIEALTLAFNTEKRNYCPIGAVKTNIGHLDAAAGVAGFIKTVLALTHRLIPPSLHFETPNPTIDFKNSPFFVNNRLTEWKSNEYPRRAGVSSFGIGGTNAHVILEETPTLEDSSKGRTFKLMLLSAKTQPALERMISNLIKHLENNPGINFSDAAYTLAMGRKHFKHRKMTVCSSIEEAMETLASRESGTVQTSILKDENTPVVFMFPGQGSQYIDMGLDLYRSESVFRQEMDRCFGILKTLINDDIKNILYPSFNAQQHHLTSSTPSTGDTERIKRTEIAQVVIFIFEYALAKLLMALGIDPYAMIGHSIGEYTCACLSGVFSLEDALKIIVIRGKLMQKMSTGSMLSIPLPEDELKPLLEDDISLAAVNSTSRCVVSGESSAINSLKNRLQKMGYESSLLHTSHAFHSSMMVPILDEFKKQINSIRLNEPKIPYISNVTGDWITALQTNDPGYWAKHLRYTVRFSEGLELLFEKKNSIFIEVGPGNGLCALVRQHKNKKNDRFVINLVRHPKDSIPDDRFLFNKIGQLWLYGINTDWSKFYLMEKRHRIPLPTYPFEQKRYWIEKNLSQLLTKLSYKSINPSKNHENDLVPDEANELLEEVKNADVQYGRPELTSPYVAPKNDIEQSLANILENFLGIERVGTNDDFFELGMDSLKIIAFGVEIYKKFNVKIPMAELFNCLNIKKLTEYLLNDSEADGKLNVEGDFNGSKISTSSEIPKNILLTGSTGFLGSHLLMELINKTDARIYCLVRGDTLDNSYHRAKKIWNYYFDRKFQGHFDERIIVLQGDIEKANLGMENQVYYDLARKVDTVVHCAANVSHFGRYEVFRTINVVGTQQVIDFCFSGVEKKMHHMSTIGVIGFAPESIVFKESDFDIGQNFEGNVYGKSKYEAEKLVYRARNNGLKASIYRIGNLVGRYKDGVFQKNVEANQIYSNIKATILLGRYPSSVEEIGGEVEMSPVDLCSEAIVKLILLKKEIDSNFHMTNSHFLSLMSFVEFINKFGFPLERVEIQTLSNVVDSKVRTQEFNRELSGIFYMIVDHNNINGSLPIVTIDNTFTTQTLEKTGFSWVEPDFEYISKILKHLVDIGYLSLGTGKKT